MELLAGDEVTVFADERQLFGPPLEVVYCSEHVVVAVKPSGILSSDGQHEDMESKVGRWLEAKGEPHFVLACHRLDSGTGGLMMLARSQEAKAAVRALMDAGKIHKTYNCIVKSQPKPEHAILKAWIKKDAVKAQVTVFDRSAPGLLTAVTEYRVIKSDGLRSLLEVKLHTGRTHQIRAHMAHINHPVLGDDKYGEREFNRQYKARNQKLWACRLEFDFIAEECPLLSDLAGKMLTCEAPFLGDIC